MLYETCNLLFQNRPCDGFWTWSYQQRRTWNHFSRLFCIAGRGGWSDTNNMGINCWLVSSSSSSSSASLSCGNIIWIVCQTHKTNEELHAEPCEFAMLILQIRFDNGGNRVKMRYGSTFYLTQNNMMRKEILPPFWNQKNFKSVLPQF